MFQGAHPTVTLLRTAQLCGEHTGNTTEPTGSEVFHRVCAAAGHLAGNSRRRVRPVWTKGCV